MAVLYKKASVNAQASLEQLWEPNLMTVVLHKKNNSGPRKMVLTNYYGRPTAAKASLEFLKFTVNAIHEYHKTPVQILCGDFNLSWQQAKELETPLRLKVLNEEQVITRTQVRGKGFRQSCLDYFLSDLPHSAMEITEPPIHTDHKLVTVSIEQPLS